MSRPVPLAGDGKDPRRIHDPLPGRTEPAGNRTAPAIAEPAASRHVPAPQPNPEGRAMRPAPLAGAGNDPRRSHGPLPAPTEPAGNRTAPARAEPGASFHATPRRNPKAAP